MPLPFFLDANVPIYAAGRPHPLKEPCVRTLTLVARHPDAFCTDAEVLQELLHRYLALHIWPQGHAVLVRFALLLRGRIEPVYAQDVEAAATLALQHVGLSARDLLHASLMARIGATHIVSADRGFDGLPGLHRLDPADVDTWSGQIVP